MGQTISIVLSIASNILLARLLGPANYGVYTLFLKICTIAQMFSQLGTNVLIVKLVSIASGTGDWGRLRGILQVIFKIVSISSITIVLFIWFTGETFSLKIFKSSKLCQILMFGVIIIPLQNGLLLIIEFFRGIQNLKIASLLPVVRQALFFIALIWIALQMLDSLPNILIVLSFSIFCTLAVGFFILQRIIKKQAPITKISARSILQESMPMMITRGSILVMSSMDVFLLGIYTNSSEVGIYSVVSSLASLTVLSLDIINQVIPAMMAHYNAKNDLKTLSYIVRYASTIGALFSTPVLILLLFFGKYILSVLFGPQYVSGVTALHLLIIGQLINSVTGSCRYMLQMTGQQVTLMKISLSCGLLNLVLNILMARYYGKEGVAAATALSLIAQNLLTVYMAHLKTGIWTLASVEMSQEIAKQARRYLCNLLSR